MFMLFRFIVSQSQASQLTPFFTERPDVFACHTDRFSDGTPSGSFPAEKADVTLTMSDTDLVDLMLGKLDAQKAFFQGKLKIKGNMGLAMRLKAFQSEMDKYKAKL